MSERNAFFAIAFSRELERWKKDNSKTQADFSELTGIHQNSISRYKKGSAYPSEPALDTICQTLKIDRSAFYPNTFEDWFTSSEEFRHKIFADQEAKEIEALGNAGVDILFWEFLWRKIPCTKTVMPIYGSNSNDDLIFLKKIRDDLFKVFRQDIEFARDLQEEVIEYITMILIKKVLHQRLDEHSDVGVVSIMFNLANDLFSHGKSEEDSDGND